MCIFLGINDLFSKKRRFSCISHSEHDILGMTEDTSLKTRVIPLKLVSIDGIRLTLQAGHKNMRVSVSNSVLFSKKLRFLYISTTEDKILCMIRDNSLKTVVIPSKLATLDRIRSTLHSERKNMCVSMRNSGLFSKERRFSCISPKEHDILGMIDDNHFENSCYSFKTILIR